MRASLHAVLVVTWCRQVLAVLALREAFDDRSEALLDECIASVRLARSRYSSITDRVLSTKAWALRRSGCVGALIKFNDNGARDNQARECNLAIMVHLSETDDVVVCCSRAVEDCLADSCAQRDTVVAALEEVRTAAGVDLAGLLGLLSEDLRLSAMHQGVAVLYGQKLCVVRREGGSWPFAVVRRKRNGARMCHACPQGPGTCTHAGAARDAGCNEHSQASGEDELIRNLGRRRTKRTNKVFSSLPRPLVPSQQSQQKHAAVMRAAASGRAITIPAPASCTVCNIKCPDTTVLRCHEGVIEYGEGSVRAIVWRWR